MDDVDLQLNFAMCFDHFQHNELKEEHITLTPLGSKDVSPNEKSESIELVETPSNPYKGPLQESTVSSASTNNTDICVLDGNDDLQFLPDDSLEEKEFSDGDEISLRSVNENEDFTVLRKPPPVKSRRLCNCEESTEVLMLINSEYHGNGKPQRKPTYSGNSDSDVEILMSEEVVESDWSSANNEEKIEKSLTFENEAVGNDRVSTSRHSKKESTDSDISEAELGELVQNEYSNLNRSQLLEIIQQQETRIKALEVTVEQYHKAQQRLFDHVDALRLELKSIHFQKEAE